MSYINKAMFFNAHNKLIKLILQNTRSKYKFGGLRPDNAPPIARIEQ